MGADKNYFDRLYSHRQTGKRPSIDLAVLGALAAFLFGIRRGGKLVDVGCGQGHFVNVVSRYFETCAFDASAYAIQSFAAPGVKRWVGSAEKIATRDDTFDVVTCFDTLEHVRSPRKAIGECYRILRPGGIFLFRTPNISSVGRKLKGADWFGFRDETHISLSASEDWKRWTKSSGFQIIETGTDFLGDPPYLTHRPNLWEKLVFQGMSFAMAIVRPYQRWTGGENVYVLARKPVLSAIEPTHAQLPADSSPAH